MRESIFVRPLEEDERKALEEGLRSKDAFVLPPPLPDPAPKRKGRARP